MSQLKLFGNRRSPRVSRTGSGAQAAGATAVARRTAGSGKKSSSAIKILTKIFLVLAILEGLYFTCAYSDIPFIKKWRTIYIETAMSTMRHQWLATAFLPKSVIDEVVDRVNAAQQAQVGINTSWGGKPGTSGNTSGNPTTPSDESGMSEEERTFYELFWELRSCFYAVVSLRAS